MKSAQRVADGKARPRDTERMLADRGPVMMRLLKCFFHFVGMENLPAVTLKIQHDPFVPVDAPGVRDPGSGISFRPSAHRSLLPPRSLQGMVYDLFYQSIAENGARCNENYPWCLLQ
jgi:hypothetical protein